MSFVEWPDKQTRDTGVEKLTSDPRMQFDGQPPAFDGKRLIAAGFKPVLCAPGEPWSSCRVEPVTSHVMTQD